MKSIYKITNLINKKVYIGQSNNPKRRWINHCRFDIKNKSLIGKAIQKFGKENFKFEVLEETDNSDEREIYYIQYYSSLVPYGYNVAAKEKNLFVNYNSKSPTAKITNEMATKIQEELLNYQIPHKQIVQKYKITNDIIRHINDGTSWKKDNLSYPLRPTEKELNNLRAEKVIELLLTTNLSQKEIGKKVGWNKSAITMINIGKNHYREDLNYPLR